MTARKVFRFVMVAVICLEAIAMAMLVYLARASSGEGPKPGWQSVEFAMLGYRANNRGAYPFAEEGADHALYMLKPFIWTKSDRSFYPRKPDDWLVDPRQKTSHRPHWDDERQLLADSGLDYINLSPKELGTYKDDPVMLSYVSEAWPQYEPLPFAYGAVDRAFELGHHYPWVRPARLVGLPAEEVTAISQYGAHWGVSPGPRSF